MIWTLVYTQQAHKDAKKLVSTHLKPKALKLLDIIAKNPYQSPPPYEKLLGDSMKTVKVLRMWTHYE